MITFPSKKDAMNALELVPEFKRWMRNWVYWDEETHEYCGSCPDEDVICRHHTPSVFVKLFNEDAQAWAERNK